MLKIYLFINLLIISISSTPLKIKQKNNLLINEKDAYKVFRIYAKSWEDVEAVGKLRKIAEESQEVSEKFFFGNF